MIMSRSSSAIVAAVCLLLFSTTANAFSVVRPDTSKLVEQALKTTATYGITSQEAKVAWDIVEEMDASDNSEATKGSLDTECEVDNPTEACLDYGKFLDELMTVRKLVEQTQNKKSASLVQALQAIQLQTPQGTKVKSSPQLTAALDAAKLATSTHGVTSVEARLAWETYEEIASAGLDNSIGVNLMEECSVEAGADACRAIEELERVLPILLSLELQK